MLAAGVVTAAVSLAGGALRAQASGVPADAALAPVSEVRLPNPLPWGEETPTPRPTSTPTARPTPTPRSTPRPTEPPTAPAPPPSAPPEVPAPGPTPSAQTTTSTSTATSTPSSSQSESTSTASTDAGGAAFGDLGPPQDRGGAPRGGPDSDVIAAELLAFAAVAQAGALMLLRGRGVL